jgi:hypothetical protein
VEKERIMQNPTNSSTDTQKFYNNNGVSQEMSNEMKSELGQNNSSNKRQRNQMIKFRLSGNMTDEFLSYVGMMGKEDYCLGWVYDGELIDWEISPVLEGRLQVTDKPERIERRKKRLELEEKFESVGPADKTV